MLTQAPIVQPPIWSKPFHMFVDASDIAIERTLMQLTDPVWYRSVNYSSCKLIDTFAPQPPELQRHPDRTSAGTDEEIRVEPTAVSLREDSTTDQQQGEAQAAEDTTRGP